MHTRAAKASVQGALSALLCPAWALFSVPGNYEGPYRAGKVQETVGPLKGGPKGVFQRKARKQSREDPQKCATRQGTPG